MHTNNLYSGLSALDRTADAANKSPSTDRHNNDIQCRMLLEEFQSDRPLPGDHIIVIEGVNEGGLFLLAPLNGRMTGFIIAVSMQDNVRAVRTSRGHFDERRRARHPDLNWNTMLSRVVGHSLAMISG